MVFFLTEAIPFVTVAFIIVIFQVVLGIRTYEEAPKTFMHDAVFFIMGSLMIASVLIKYNLHQKIAEIILGRSSRNINFIVFGIVTTSALLASFLSEHTVSSIMLPIGVGLVTLSGGIKKCPKLGKLLMLSISYGCMIGSIGTPSGGVRNVIMMEYLKKFSGVTIGYGEWILYSMPLTFVLIPIVSFILTRIFKTEINEIKITTIYSNKSSNKILTGKEISVILIFVLTLILWILFSSSFGLGIISVFSASLYLITGLARWEDYSRTVRWEVILLYAGVISLGQCLEDTGLSSFIANSFIYFVSDVIQVKSSLVIIVCVTVFTLLLANTMGAGSAIAVIGPIALQIGRLTNINPIQIGVACAISSSFSYLMIPGAPANMIVYGSGFLKPKDFLKSGWIMSIITILVLTFVIVGLYWKYVLGIG
jgi:sodium-dependent dicarboxylate transporter 2/3/5